MSSHRPEGVKRGRGRPKGSLNKSTKARLEQSGIGTQEEQ